MTKTLKLYGQRPTNRWTTYKESHWSFHMSSNWKHSPKLSLASLESQALFLFLSICRSVCLSIHLSNYLSLNLEYISLFSYIFSDGSSCFDENPIEHCNKASLAGNHCFRLNILKHGPSFILSGCRYRCSCCSKLELSFSTSLLHKRAFVWEDCIKDWEKGMELLWQRTVRGLLLRYHHHKLSLSRSFLSLYPEANEWFITGRRNKLAPRWFIIFLAPCYLLWLFHKQAVKNLAKTILANLFSILWIDNS